MIDNSQTSLENVLSRLRADHREVQALLCLYVIEPSIAGRQDLLARVCRMMRLHCAVEAGVFVPAVAAATDNQQLLEETGSAFARVTGMLNELAHPRCASEKLSRLVAELHSYINEHVAAAESDSGVFGLAHRLRIDWSALQKVFDRRRAELSQQLGAAAC